MDYRNIHSNGTRITNTRPHAIATSRSINATKQQREHAQPVTNAKGTFVRKKVYSHKISVYM